MIRRFDKQSRLDTSEQTRSHRMSSSKEMLMVGLRR